MPINNLRADLKVSFQGGGARISELIAAAHALQEIHDDPNWPNVRVSLVAGTSAGSIAAALFYTNADFNSIVKKNAILKKSIDKNFKQWKIFLPYFAARMAFNKPLFSEKSLSNLLYALFETGGIKSPEKAIKTFRDQKRCKDIFILAADLKNGETGEHGTDSSKGLIEALIDSSAIPFVFRTAKSTTASAHMVDGGIFENLPGKVVSKELQDHTIPLAFSFQQKEPGRVGEYSVKKYAGLILSRMIDRGIDNAKLHYKDEAIIELKSDKETLDFHNIFHDKFEKEYGEIKDTIKAKIIKSITTHGIQEVDWHSNKAIDIIRKNRHISENAAEFSDYLKAGLTFHVDKLTMTGTANSLLDINVPDIQELVMTFDGNKNNGLQYIKSTLYLSKNGKLAIPTLTLEERKGTSRKWTKTPTIFIPLSPDGTKRTLLIVFPKPMQEGCFYRFTKLEKIYDNFKGFREGNLDFDALTFSKGKAVDKLEINTTFPEQYAPKQYLHLNEAEHGQILNKLFETPEQQAQHNAAQKSGSTKIVNKNGWTTYTSKFKNVTPDVANYVATVYK